MMCFSKYFVFISIWLHLHDVTLFPIYNHDQLAEELEFGDRIIEMSIGFDHLVVATARQCYIYSLQNLSTPHIFDLKGSVSLILQSDRYEINNC